MREQKRIAIEQIQALKAQLDLREIAAQFTDLRGGREQYGPCPRCGGVDRFHVQQHMFHCRQCFGPEIGGRHDVFDFAQFVGLARGFSDAYQVVAGWANTIPSPVRPTFSPEVEVSYATPRWQARVRQEVIHCSRRLLVEQGSQGRDYLAQRGLTPATWELAKLGLAYRKDATGQAGWAISVPWLYQGKVTALQYRFLAPQGQRYMRFGYDHYYGETLLYTLPPKPQTDAIVVVEGELNALSIYQATAYDAVSFGSQNMTQQTLQALRNHIQDYERVCVWADEESVTTAVLQALEGRGEGIVASGDANEMLQQGQLQQVLA